MNDAPRRMPAPVITIALIALNVVAFGLELWRGADAMNPHAYDLRVLGANFGPFTLGDEPWRLVTAMFLHGGALHLLMNMLGLWFGGSVVELCYGRAGFTALYLIAGLVGGVATVLFSPMATSVGASGAIFGVFGALGAWLLVHRRRIDPAAVRQTATRLGLLLLINAIASASIPSIDNAAHIGGFLGGFLFALALEAPGGGSRSLARIAITTALALGAIAVTVAVRPAPGVPAIVLAPPGHLEAYREFDQVHTRALVTFNGLLDQRRAGQIDDAGFARRLDAEIVVPWQALQARLRALPPLAPRPREVHDALVAYVDARLAHWRAIGDHLRGMAVEQEALNELRDRADRAMAAFEQVLAEAR